MVTISAHISSSLTLPGQVFGVAAASPADHLVGNHAAAQFPFEKACAGVARPERAVAVEDRELRLQLQTDFTNSSFGERRVQSSRVLAFMPVRESFRLRISSAA